MASITSNCGAAYICTTPIGRVEIEAGQTMVLDAATFDAVVAVSKNYIDAGILTVQADPAPPAPEGTEPPAKPKK
jgi:hypothetical protein